MNQKLKAFLKDPMGNIPEWLFLWAIFLSISTLMILMLCLIIGKILGK